MMLKRKNSSVVSLGDIAREAGISRVAVYYALQNSSGVSSATRDKVLAIAKRLGYFPDARINILMANVRNSKSKDFLPIMWLNTIEKTETWEKAKYLSPYLEGARERARQLGYRIDEMWLYERGMTPTRLSNILYKRGIEGVIITYPARHVHLDCSHFAGVALEGSLLAPRLHRVTKDPHYNLLLAIKMLKRHGYKRIGICLENDYDIYSAHSVRAAAAYFHATTPQKCQVPPLFYTSRNEKDQTFVRTLLGKWLLQYKPEVVIGHSLNLVEWVEAAGFRVPEEVGVVHLATDDDAADWAGVCSNRRQVGAFTVDLVVSLIRNRQFGVPEMAVDTLIRGSWHFGRTLLIPNQNGKNHTTRRSRRTARKK